MRLRETRLKMYSLWYDHSDVNIFHVMENCEEKLCSWVRIGAKNMLSVEPTKSGLNSQKSRYSCRSLFTQSIKVLKLMKQYLQVDSQNARYA